LQKITVIVRFSANKNLESHKDEAMLSIFKQLPILLLFFPLMAFSHGNHGSGSISNEDIFASPWHLHLPVEIGLDGSTHYGYGGHNHSEEEHHDDHDDHDEDHHDEDGHEDHDDDHDDDHEDEHESKWSIHPSLIFGGDKISRVMALDKVLVGSRNGEVQRTNGSKGFIVIKNTKITAGLGLDLDYHLPTSGLFGIGISAVKGSNKYSERFIQNLEDKKNLKPLKAPKTLEDLKSWTTGDRLVFGATGGFTLMSHFGMEPFFHAGPLYHAGGSWLVKVKKLNDTKIELRIIKNKVEALAIEADGIFVSAEVEKFDGQDKFMSFIFDLSNLNAEIALEKLYKGDLKYAQMLMTQENTGVTRQTKGSSLSSGKSKIVKFSLPFFFGASKAKAKLSSYGNEEDLERNSKTKVYTSVVSVETTTRGILSRHKMAIKNFYANFADEWHVDHQHVSFGGAFKWMYEKDKVRAKTVMNKLEKLQKITGMYKSLDLKLPKEKLGYFRVEFDTNISNKDTLKIMGLPENKQASVQEFFATAKTNSHNLIVDYFMTRNPKELCPILSTKKCMKKMKRKSVEALNELSQLSLRMKKLFQEKKYKEWTKVYAKWGSQLISNQFVFKSVLSELKKTKYSISIKGEKVATQTLKLKLK